MKKNFIVFLAILCNSSLSAQNDTLIKWNIQVKHIRDSLFELTANTTIPKGWHLYGKNPSQELEGIKFIFDYENVQSRNPVQVNRTAEKINDPAFKNEEINVYTGTIKAIQQLKINGVIPSALRGSISAFLGRNDEFLTAEQSFEVAIAGGGKTSADSQRIRISSVDITQPLANCVESGSPDDSLWTVFFLGLFGGLIALLTPCVFPMIPVTVSFFTRRSGTGGQSMRNGALYGFFIFVIYTLISLPFHLIGNADPGIFNTIATNSTLNIIFFLVFIAFALSFFGFFEITLPSHIAGKADSRSNLESLGGIFFMALTLVIVSFSCTGVILGSLLVGYLKNGAWPLTAGLSGFGLALALPFAVFAVFPGWLKSIPKSGGWLDIIKKCLAFIELGLAFKFLSNADLVMHWGLLKREVFIGIWILVSIGLTLYLFGAFRLPHDAKGMKIGTGRKIAGIFTTLFTFYLIPGITQTPYANLHLLSGFPPPLNYSIYGKDNVRGKGLEANVINDYEAALQLAKEQNKLLLIDFTGWACVNCRKMEENVWTKPEVYNYIRNNFILVSLYVDDRQKLPVEQRTTYTKKDGSKKNIETNGDKWATFEEENFIQASQPLYVILDNNEKLINHPVGYTPNAKEYREWLQCGIETSEAKK